MNRANRTRSREGCLPCRYHKRKCDGTQPRCRNCGAANRQCRWGVKVTFHPSRQLRLSSEESTALLALEEERGGIRRGVRFVDKTAQIVREYEQASEDVDEQIREDEIPVEANDSPPAQIVSECALAGGSQTNSSNGEASNGEASNSSAPLPLSSVHCSPPVAAYDNDIHASELEQLQLMRVYLQEPGAWCELTDAGRHFTVSYVYKLMTNKPLVAAAMALGSRQLDAVRRTSRQSTLNLYQHAVSSLARLEVSQCGEASLACCVLLSMYEMMTSDVVEWRRHLKGCASNLTNGGWNGSSLALVGVSFWTFARMDVWAAYFLREKTLIPPERWTDDANPALTTAMGNPDHYCNLMTLILAKIVNLLATGIGNAEFTAVNALWNNLQAWHYQRPTPMTPLFRSNNGSTFPHILFAGDSTACGNVFYHTGCMLLLRTGQVHRGYIGIDTQKHDQVWHAKELCGISVTNTSHTNWVNHVHCLHIAGQAFSSVDGDEDNEEHASQKIALLKHLAKIERETGWPTADRAADLRRLWALD